MTLFLTGEDDVKFVLKQNVINHTISHIEHHCSTHEDPDGVDPNEFTELCEHLNAEQFSNESFLVADADKDGRLSKKELAHGLRHAGEAFRTYFQQKYLAESKRKMCAIGVYVPVYLETGPSKHAGDGFETAAAVLNALQFALWIVSSAGYLVMCPVHTVFCFFMTIFVAIFIVILATFCTIVWRFVRYMMGKPTHVIGAITVADLSAVTFGVIGVILVAQIMHRIYIWWVPEEWVMVLTSGGKPEL
jgi:hypothetical protein